MKKNNGGKRIGAGRPKKEPTIQLGLRIPKSVFIELKRIYGKELYPTIRKAISGLSNKIEIC